MGSAYLLSGEAAAFGLASATAAQIQDASGVVDAFLNRPEGMVWTPDADGRPCYMAGLYPMSSLTASGSIAPGQNVAVTATGGMISSDLVGEVLILDRATPGATEACVVVAVTDTAVTLDRVRHAHSSGVLMEAGLTILEERSLPANRNVSRVSRTPFVRLIGGVGRYSYGRRSDQMAGDYLPNLIGSLQAFGAPIWVPFNVADCSISQSTGEVWVPAGIVGAYFSDVRLRYVAGYPFSGLPAPIKQATAKLIDAMQRFPEINGNIKKLQAGGTTIERFGDSLLDSETRARLAPFQAKIFF